MFPVGITTGYGLPLNKQPLADMKKNGIDYIELSLVREYDVSFQQIGQMTLEADIGSGRHTCLSVPKISWISHWRVRSFAGILWRTFQN